MQCIENYESPCVEIVEIETEQGFALSITAGGENADWDSPF